MEQIEDIREMIRRTVADLDRQGMELKQAAVQATNDEADYEERKASFLVALFEEEAELGFKRTESQRQSLYRRALKDDRRRANLSRETLQADRELYRGLQTKINALQTLARMIEAEMRLG